MKVIFAKIGFLFLLPLSLMGQSLIPPIQNYRIFEYKASSKNWGLTVSDDGELFVANNQGLLHFNGEEWALHKLPHETTIRSVAYIDNKVFSGSYEEFGYWQKNDFGLLEYTSLTHLIKNHEFTSEEFWEILPYDNGILFRSFSSSIYLYKNDEITIIDVEIVVSKIAPYQDRIMVAGAEGKLFWLDDEKLIPLKGDQLLKGKTVIDLVQMADGLLIGTKLNGCYLLKNGELVSWEKEINDELKLQQLNKILPLASGNLAFGTIKNGIYVYDSDSSKIEKLNRESGLQNNTVLSMLQFENQLWTGLDNGISRIQLDNPITYFTDNTGLLGTVYDMEWHNEVLYLGSNTGIYFFEDDRLQFVKGTQGHVWDLEILEGDLFGGHNTGTFELLNGEVKNTFNYSGGYQFAKIPDRQRTYLQGTYNGLVKFFKQDSGNWQVSRVAGVPFPVEQLCFENQNTIWAAHPYKGLYRVEISEDYDEVLYFKEYMMDSIQSNYNIELFNIKNQIVINNEGSWYKYDPILDRIVHFEQFEPYTNKNLLFYDDAHFWFLNNDESKEITFVDFQGDDLAIGEPQLSRRQVPEAENIIKSNDSTYYFTLGDGFAKIDFLKLKSQLYKTKPSIPKLSSFSAGGKKQNLNQLPSELSFPKSRNVEIKVTAPSDADSRYYYELDGMDVLSGEVDNGTINFQNLGYGEHNLKVSTVGSHNKKSAPLEVDFAIAPPWYLSKLSILGYFFATLGMVYVIRLYNRKKLRRKQKELKEQLLRQQEDKLAQMEKDKLAKEIRLKQNELAISAMSIAEKNELLLELKNMLVMNKEQFSNNQRYRNFMKKLDNSIHGDEDWKRFEFNFNELHEDFFNNLLQKYPKLTPKDLKLCAYLKMNLSTKEIAPLMAISVRGVEIHRYRLRKKLKIESSENISNFLITFK